MRRRQALAGSLALVFGGLAGCIAGGPGGAATTTRPDGTGSPTGADGPKENGTAGGDTTLGCASDAAPSVADASLRMTGGGCTGGSDGGSDEATVAFGDDRVTVTGTITGSDACKHPRLGRVGYDPAADALVVLVETYSEGEMCSQCLVALGYEATVRFENAVPRNVVVRHASRGEERAVTRSQR